MNPRKALILLESAQDYEPGCFCREPAGEILCSLFSHLHAAAHLTPPVSLSAPICGMNSPHQSPRPVIGQKCPLLKSAAGGIRLHFQSMGYRSYSFTLAGMRSQFWPVFWPTNQYRFHNVHVRSAGTGTGNPAKWQNANIRICIHSVLRPAGCH